MDFPEMMELRRLKTRPPQLLILGAELKEGKVVAPGYVTFEPLRKGRRFWWKGYKLELTQALPGRQVHLYPVNTDQLVELEIVHGPQ